MKERPILFSAPMVRAILEGRKTQTRRVVKPIPQMVTDKSIVTWDGDAASLMRLFDQVGRSCPYGKPGERLWVRETWRYTASSLEESRAITEDIASGIAVDWRATYIDNCMKLLGFSREEAEMADDFETWRPSIHMPRWASRILLEITGVRVERLQDISEDDVLAEGFMTREGKDAFNVYGSREFFIPEMLDKNPSGRVASGANSSAQQAYRNLWESINGAGSWDANPWVWVVEFKRVEGGAA